MSPFRKAYNNFLQRSHFFSRENLFEWIGVEISALQETQKTKPLEIINVGAGGAAYDQINRFKNAKIIQIDIDEERNPDIVADVCEMPMFKDNSIDAIFMIEVLEHVAEPWRAIPEINRILKPGGRLIVSTPFIFPAHDEPYDFYRYTRYGLEYLLKDFDDVLVRERGSYINSIYALFARMMTTTNRKMKPLGIITFLFTVVLYPIFWIISKLYKNHQATVGYFTTANKKI